MKPIYPYGQGNLNTPHLHDIGGRPVYGDVLFVDSNNGNAGTSANEGTKRKPFATIDSAINQCEGDETIYVAPGHTEIISTADQIDVDVAGVSIIGCGNGKRRPTLTYTVAAGEVAIGADNVYIENIRFVSSVTEVLKGVDVEDGVDGFHMNNCSFTVEADTTDDFISALVFVNDNNDCIVENCVFDSGLQAHAVNGILMDADCDNMIIRNNRIHGDYSTACITNDTAICLEILIQGNILQNGDTTGNNGEPTMELGASTGLIIGNFLADGTATDGASVVATGAMCFANEWTTTVGSDAGVGTTTTTVNT